MKYIYIVTLFLLVSFLLWMSWRKKDSDQQFKTQLLEVIEGKNATVGVSVLGDDGFEYGINDTLSFPMMSVFKYHVALTLLDHLSSNGIPLSTKLDVAKERLLPDTYSPLRDENPDRDIDIAISDLLLYMVAYSDNNACDILIDYVGGVAVVDDYIRSLGIGDVTIVATEEMMHLATENSYLNRVTPLSMVRLMKLIDDRQPIPSHYANFLTTTMVMTSTGSNKLKGLLPKDVRVGHKTGSSDRTSAGVKIGDNDAGFVILPNGKRYYIAVFITNSAESDDTNAEIIAKISKLVYDRALTKY